MVVSLWSVKGGAGVSVVAAGVALGLSRRHPEVLLVDLAGDLPAVLGIPEPSGPGVTAWSAVADRAPSDGLQRCEIAIGHGLALLPRGEGLLRGDDAGRVLVSRLVDDRRPVVVDCGSLGTHAADADDEGFRRAVARGASRSLLVSRACYLGLRRAVASSLRPGGIVLVADYLRVLDANDVEYALGVPVVATVPVEPAVSRSVDSGLLAARVPAALSRALEPLVADHPAAA